MPAMIESDADRSGNDGEPRQSQIPLARVSRIHDFDGFLVTESCYQGGAAIEFALLESIELLFQAAIGDGPH